MCLRHVSLRCSVSDYASTEGIVSLKVHQEAERASLAVEKRRILRVFTLRYAHVGISEPELSTLLTIPSQETPNLSFSEGLSAKISFESLASIIRILKISSQEPLHMAVVHRNHILPTTSTLQEEENLP